MARRQPASATARAGVKTSEQPEFGEGTGKTEPAPRPSDSALLIPESFDAAPGVVADAPIYAADVLKPSPIISGGPVYVYPFGWQRGDLRRFIFLSITTIIAVVFLWYVQSILPPFLLAFFLAALFEPTLREFERHGRTRVRGIVTLYVAGLCVVGIAAFIVVPRVITQANQISGNLNGYVDDVQTSANAFMASHTTFLNHIGIQQTNIKALMDAKAAPIKALVSNVLTSVVGSLAGLASRALWLVIIPLTTFFFMRDYPMLRARIITQFPERYHDRIDIMSREVMDVFSAYLRGLAKICSLYSVVAIILYSMLGLNYALILGIFAGVFYAVPYVGQLFTAIGTGLIAYLADKHVIFYVFRLDLPQHSIPYTLTVVVVALLVQNVFDQILYPRIVGGSVGLHPVASIFALMAGATLFGIWGMLFAVPVAASIQIIIMYFFPKVRMAPAQALLNTETPTS